MTAIDVVLTGGKVTTLDAANPQSTAVAISGHRIAAAGTDDEVLALATQATKRIDLKGRRVVPGLTDSHIHLIRGGLTFNLELRWDGLPSLADAMDLLKKQVAITLPPQWVRVVGGFCELQFAEKRLPTIKELNALAPDTPVLITHLYDRALLNAAALRACGYTKQTPNPPRAHFERDRDGNPIGLIVAEPDPWILYATLAKAPKLEREDQRNSTRQFMRELNRFGVTGINDAGGGFFAYPQDYDVARELAEEGLATLRMAYNLLPQTAGRELSEFSGWVKDLTPNSGGDIFRHNGAGEMLVYSAGDFEDFQQARPELATSMEDELEPVVRLLVEHRWPFRLHATYDETISRALDVYERVNRDTSFEGIHWFFDHAETISPRNIDRVAALGGGIAIQHRMAYQGEYFIKRYGSKAAESTPPIRRMLEAGIPVGAGTDATRVSSHNPWMCMHWLVTGKTVGGTSLYPARNCLDRDTALMLWTRANPWFSSEEGKKGQIKSGQYADLAVLSQDYFAIAEDDIPDTRSVLTMLGGKVVYGSDDYTHLSLSLPPASPSWSPVGRFGGAHSPREFASKVRRRSVPRPRLCEHAGLSSPGLRCNCWAF